MLHTYGFDLLAVVVHCTVLQVLRLCRKDIGAHTGYTRVITAQEFLEGKIEIWLIVLQTSCRNYNFFSVPWNWEKISMEIWYYGLKRRFWVWKLSILTHFWLKYAKEIKAKLDIFEKWTIGLFFRHRFFLWFQKTIGGHQLSYKDIA